jgi:DNA-binding winged helix-turn-helix (wHTH) protein
MDYFAHMKPSFLFGTIAMVIVILVSAGAFISKKNEAPEKHVEVVLRDIGHQLLLSARDSSSRVLPVKKLNKNTYQVSFQNDVGFISDTLINIVQRTFQKNTLASSYIVNLRNCEQKKTVLAFEINGKTGDITPCRGRTLERGCYVIEIDLLKESALSFLWLLLIIPLGFAGYAITDRFQKKEAEQSNFETSDYIQVGNFKLYTTHNVLKTDLKTIPLSEKETKALEIFSRNINQVVEREKLMKELWEAEGTVVISRNVDVLVSKLRKKLSDDHDLKFVNVHGRGYKLVAE